MSKKKKIKTQQPVLLCYQNSIMKLICYKGQVYNIMLLKKIYGKHILMLTAAIFLSISTTK